MEAVKAKVEKVKIAFSVWHVNFIGCPCVKWKSALKQNRMKKVLMLFMVFAALATINATAQRRPLNLSSGYTTALGLKVWGDGAGVSIKHFIAPHHALEGIGYVWNGGTRITGLYEFHFDIDGVPGLKWYVGPGAHVGLYNSYYYDRRYPNNRLGYRSSGSFAGVDGVIGLDYKFTGAPINVSLDWQPSFEFGNDRGFFGGWGGAGVRYTF